MTDWFDKYTQAMRLLREIDDCDFVVLTRTQFRSFVRFISSTPQDQQAEPDTLFERWLTSSDGPFAKP